MASLLIAFSKKIHIRGPDWLAFVLVLMVGFLAWWLFKPFDSFLKSVDSALTEEVGTPDFREPRGGPFR